jgi:hypothetical protein
MPLSCLRRFAVPRLAPRVVALTALFVAAGLDTAEARRLALVVGNAEYAAVAPLRNAVRDAQDVAAALTRLGFEVTLLTDVTSAAFWDRVDAFAEAAETAETTLFFYSGHAFQLSGVNYLVPVDARLQSREAITAETWSLDGIIARLQDRRRQTLIFLDACRNDPLPQSVRGSGQADGLARLQTGVGTFVAFATEPGAVTYDGTGEAQNSPFTTALLRHIEAPGLSVSDLMINVRNDVEEATLRRQTPWDQSSLREQFYFAAAPAAGRQELSEADYELLASLLPEDRAKFLELLRQSGFSADSLRRADEAISIAQANLEIVAEAEVTIAAAPAAGPVPIAAVQGGDLSALEIAPNVVDVGLAGAVAALPPDAVALPRPAPALPAAEAVAALSPEAAAAAAPAAAIAARIAPAVPSAVPGAAAPLAAAAVRAEQVAALAPTGPVPAGAAGAVAPGAVLPVAEPSALVPLGADLGPPVRVAALTWETRGILELNAVGGDRDRVPGAEVTPDTPEGRAMLEAIDPRLVQGGEIVLDLDPRAVARAAQAELKRLGCYHLAVDGSWGNGSRTALTSYHLARREVPESLEPTPALIGRLKLESKVVCEVRVAKAVVKGKTRPILAKPEAAPKVVQTTVRNPKTNRVIATPEVRNEQRQKAAVNPGGF